MSVGPVNNPSKDFTKLFVGCISIAVAEIPPYGLSKPQEGGGGAFACRGVGVALVTVSRPLESLLEGVLRVLLRTNWSWSLRLPVFAGDFTRCFILLALQFDKNRGDVSPNAEHPAWIGRE